MKKLRILLADDHIVMRMGCVLFLTDNLTWRS